ncbi:STAS domain-containing protein [Sphingomonas sp. VNH70]|uniref:STAS domain-containing protein n=1 Tax=Sphingomonas silueang TaxID=3156617 RepID=UPI0032B41879
MAPLPLPAVIDTAAAAPLRAMLLDAIAAGRPLLLDGSAVERIGQAGLQVLAAAQVTAAARGLLFRIADPAPALSDMATLAALPTLLAA